MTFTDEMRKSFSIQDWYDLSGQVAVVTGGASGLGLAITKEIINAHHENINVISTVGVGTEFIFTLPRSKMEEGL